MHLIDRGCRRSKTSSDWLWIHLNFKTSKSTKDQKNKESKKTINKEKMFGGLVGSTSSHVQTSMENIVFFGFFILFSWFCVCGFNQFKFCVH